MIGAGVAFGYVYNLGQAIVIASIVMWIAEIGSMSSSFLLGRYLFHQWATKQIKEYKMISALNNVLESRGFFIVFLCRLSPIVPFNLFSILMGSSKVQFAPYLLGSAFVVLPELFAL